MADVLIFDDDPSVGDLMGELLRGRGLTVSHFLSGAGVVQLVQENKPRLVVLDIMMPGMDGLTALRTLKSTPDAEKCAYCALAFNDGSRGWALSEIVPFGSWKRPQEAALTVMPGTEWGEDVAAADAVAALASCLAANGAVHDRELAYLDAYARRRGVSAERVEKMVEEALAGRLPYAPPNGAGLSLLRGLIRMSLADGHVEDSERVLLASAARGAGLHELELKAMIQEERTALAARARELLERLG